MQAAELSLLIASISIQRPLHRRSTFNNDDTDCEEPRQNSPEYIHTSPPPSPETISRGQCDKFGGFLGQRHGGLSVLQIINSKELPRGAVGIPATANLAGESPNSLPAEGTQTSPSDENESSESARSVTQNSARSGRPWEKVISQRTIEQIRFAAVSYDQRHVLIDGSAVDRFPAISLREHGHSLAHSTLVSRPSVCTQNDSGCSTTVQGGGKRRSVIAPTARSGPVPGPSLGCRGS